MRWHFGLGGVRQYNPLISRTLTRGIAYMQPTEDYRTIYKVAGLPPRTSFAYIVQNNINITNFIGDVENMGGEGGVYY